MNGGRNEQPGEHSWIRYKWPLFCLTKLGLPPKPPPSCWGYVLICHLRHQAPGGCRDLMNGARASVPSRPSITFCGCAALQTNNSCCEASAALTDWRHTFFIQITGRPQTRREVYQNALLWLNIRSHAALKPGSSSLTEIDPSQAPGSAHHPA